ncbi:NAD(P)-binding protein, partial [Sporormia fimetaria CBS 119925]
SSGIGEAIAHYLLSRSHKLVLVSRTQSALEKLKSRYPDGVEVLAGDLSDFSLGAKAVERAISRWNQLDGVIVNHGTLDPVKRIADVTAEEWRKGFDINAFSAIALISPALPHLRRTNGRILLVSSGAALGAYQGWGAYGASKAVLNHLAMTLTVEEPDVTSISIRPGVVDTEMQREIREEHHTRMSSKDAEKFHGLKREGGLLRPEQPGHVIAQLAVDAPKELSGEFLNWDDPNKLGAYQEK